MITRFYYTLDELNKYGDVPYVSASFASLFNTWGIAYAEGTNTAELYNHIAESYMDDYIAYIDIQHPAWEEVDKPSVSDIITQQAYAGLAAQIRKQIRKIKGWLDDAQFRYDKLLGLYADGTSANPNWGKKLMDKIGSVSTIQFNDTPQTTNTGLDDDDFASSYTKNTSSADAGTVIARLDEIRKAWHSIYAEWVSEFARKFVLY